MLYKFCLQNVENVLRVRPSCSNHCHPPCRPCDQRDHRLSQVSSTTVYKVAKEFGRLQLEDKISTSKRVNPLIQAILDKIGFQIIRRCSGLKKIAPWTAIFRTISCGPSWRGSPTSVLTTIWLRSSIIEALSNMNKNHMIKVCSRFRSRLEALVEAEGGWIE
uniref:Uncharacterized protein n=1 Tax=Lepeophtheirus salmonis TaxID=72036 RepID=A0A0K2VI58_LEPSM